MLGSDGYLVSWHGRDMTSAASTPMGRATDDDRNRLWAELNTAGFFGREVNDPGNLNRFVRVEAAADTQMWNWNHEPGPDSTDRAVVWNACQELVRRVQDREER